MKKTRFGWDEDKDRENRVKHNVSFYLAQRAFLDPHRVIAKDLIHSTGEERFYCMGQVNDEIITVRFTFRGGIIRIFGAGYWRKGKKIYEEENKVRRRASG